MPCSCASFIMLKWVFLFSSISIYGPKTIQSHNILVSTKGNDTVSCGASSSPCKTIRFAVSNISHAGDTILIDAAKEPYKECESCPSWKSAIIINKSLSIVGHKGIAVIQCEYGCNLFEVLQGNSTPQSRVEFTNLSLSTAQTAVHYVGASLELVLKNCWLKRNRIGIALRSSPYSSLRMVNCTFKDNYEWGVYSKKCFNMTSIIMSTRFISSLVLLETIQAVKKDNHTKWQEFNTFIWNCIFTNVGNKQQKCPTLLTIKTVSMATNITIRQSVFSNSSSLCNTLFIEEATQNLRETTFITLDDLLVENNHNSKRIFMLNPFYKRSSKFKVNITNSIFRRNTARTLLVEIKKWKSNKFPRNVYVLLNNNTFSKNGHLFNHSTALYSPVIYLGRGRHRLYGCRFVDNYPHGTPNSAVVVISNTAQVVIKNCLFLKTYTTKSLQLYAESNSKILFKETNLFEITATLSNQVIMEHEPFTPTKGALGEVQIRGSVKMVCPPGYRFDLMNHNRHHGRVLTWEYFHASCVQCPRKTYSIKRGVLQNNITNYIRCYNCPRGAVCQSGQLYVTRGFWGYEKRNHHIDTKSCPTGYCCEEDICNPYNHCNGNRTGTLCARCPEGTSEPLSSTRCRKNEDCISPSFWGFFLILLILYFLFFLFHEEITQFVIKSLPSIHCFNISNDRNSRDQSGHQKNTSLAGGYLKIFFFYYQMANVILEGMPTGRHMGFWSKAKSSVSQVMNIIIVNFSFQDCPFRSLRPVPKIMFLHSLGLWLLLLIFLAYLFYRLVCWIKERKENNSTVQLNSENSNEVGARKSNVHFGVRIGCAFTYVCLLMYTTSAKLCFSLLNCVSVGKDNVLFIDGTIRCFQTFQYFIMVYIVFSVLPFCFVPVLGCYLLFLKRISPQQFYLGCLFPLPYCCYWSYNLIRYCKRPTDTELPNVTSQGYSADDAGRQALLRILSGPFRNQKRFFGLPTMKIPWEGVLILSRLIAILSLTLSSDNRVRSLIMLVICLAILVFHIYTRPFTSAHENFLATLSLCSIITICALNLVKAMYHGEDCSSCPFSQFLLNGSDTAISTLLVIPFALLAFLVFIVLFVKIILKLFVLLKQTTTALHLRIRGIF